MTQPDNDELDEIKPVSSGSTSIDPPRDVIALEKSESSGADGQSYEQGDAAPNETDLKATLRRLFPQYPYSVLGIVSQSIMVARVAPDMFLSSMRLTVNAVVEELDLLEIEFNFIAIVQMVYSAFSIGLDGKGRIDVLEVAGAAKESEELERVSKQLGIS
jgi:hypothetical protein